MGRPYLFVIWMFMSVFIHCMNVRGIDLNLLVVFEALMKERSVSRAAHQIGLSQPATSNALGRLRQVFDDPLLVRRGNMMVPTPRALELAGHVHAGLAHLQAALESPDSFDAGVSTRSFVIATNDYGALVVLAPLMRRLREQAPGVTLMVRNLTVTSPRETLASGEVDLVITRVGPVTTDSPHESIYEDRFVSLVREGHPQVGKRLTLRRYVELDHLLISPRGKRQGVVDTALEQRGYERHVALWVPHFLLAPAIVARTDLVVTMAERVAREVASRYGLRVFPVPVALSPIVGGQFWDPRHEDEPGHRWLRQMVRESVDDPGWG